jgi:hypothetical protein
MEWVSGSTRLPSNECVSFERIIAAWRFASRTYQGTEKAPHAFQGDVNRRRTPACSRRLESARRCPCVNAVQRVVTILPALVLEARVRRAGRRSFDVILSFAYDAQVGEHLQNDLQ